MTYRRIDFSSGPKSPPYHIKILDNVTVFVSILMETSFWQKLRVAMSSPGSILSTENRRIGGQDCKNSSKLFIVLGKIVHSTNIIQNTRINATKNAVHNNHFGRIGNTDREVVHRILMMWRGRVCASVPPRHYYLEGSKIKPIQSSKTSIIYVCRHKYKGNSVGKKRKYSNSMEKQIMILLFFSFFFTFAPQLRAKWILGSKVGWTNSRLGSPSLKKYSLVVGCSLLPVIGSELRIYTGK